MAAWGWRVENMGPSRLFWEPYRPDIAVELYEAFHRSHPIQRHFNHTLSFQPVDDPERLAMPELLQPPGTHFA
jgi:hypothetical protein